MLERIKESKFRLGLEKHVEPMPVFAATVRIVPSGSCSGRWDAGMANARAGGAAMLEINPWQLPACVEGKKEAVLRLLRRAIQIRISALVIRIFRHCGHAESVDISIVPI